MSMNIFLSGSDNKWKEKVRDGVSSNVNCYFPTVASLYSDIDAKSNAFKFYNSDILFFVIDEKTWVSDYYLGILQDIDNKNDKLLVLISNNLEVKQRFSKLFYNNLFLEDVDDIFDFLKTVLPDNPIMAY